jgi:hypothetical protein
MGWPPRRGLRSGLTVLAVIGALAVVGRLWSAALAPPTAGLPQAPGSVPLGGVGGP